MEYLFIVEAYSKYQRRRWHPNPVLLPGKSHGWRSLEGCSPWGRWGSDITERLHFHFSLSCIEEGNGNPLQCSCLENPRDRGDWWAAVYGVAQSWTLLKQLSSSIRVKRAVLPEMSEPTNVRGVVTTEITWPAKLKIFTFLPLIEKNVINSSILTPLYHFLQ